MNLIIEALFKYSGDAWQGYDQHFRQRVALTTKYAMDYSRSHTMEPFVCRPHQCQKMQMLLQALSLSIVVTGHQNQLPHSSGADLPRNLCSPPYAAATDVSHGKIHCPHDCSFPSYKYEHISCICAKIPLAIDLAHKVIYCAH